ncbi:hypothetical protein O9993_18765 [Vibrio lentus]|nr:hypothetical protein [Vibrio lentus]
MTCYSFAIAITLPLNRSYFFLTTCLIAISANFGVAAFSARCCFLTGFAFVQLSFNRRPSFHYFKTLAISLNVICVSDAFEQRVCLKVSKPSSAFSAQSLGADKVMSAVTVFDCIRALEQ